ncbi:hypothetical protein BDZ91DRAFT_791092 [Kalaharituber pfeilii]|nr:hypothetical protein BDZ91DRAFT_791092 [Kalaharituber pfeilii]
MASSSSTALPTPSGEEIKAWDRDGVLQHFKKTVPSLDDEDLNILKNNKVTGAVLPDITVDTLMAVGMVLGPAVLISREIDRITGRTAFKSILKNGLPPLGGEIGNMSSSSRAKKENHHSATIKVSEFGFIDGLSLNEPPSSPIWGTYQITGDLTYASEAAIVGYVMMVMNEIISLAGKAGTISLQEEMQLREQRPDIWVICDNGLPVGIIKIKKPSDTIMDDPLLAGQVFDYLTLLKSFYGIEWQFAIVSTYEQWRFFWLPDANDAVKQTSVVNPNNPSIINSLPDIPFWASMKNQWMFVEKVTKPSQEQVVTRSPSQGQVITRSQGQVITRSQGQVITRSQTRSQRQVVTRSQRQVVTRSQTISQRQVVTPSQGQVEDRKVHASAIFSYSNQELPKAIISMLHKMVNSPRHQVDLVDSDRSYIEMTENSWKWTVLPNNLKGVWFGPGVKKGAKNFICLAYLGSGAEGLVWLATTEYDEMKKMLQAEEKERKAVLDQLQNEADAWKYFWNIDVTAQMVGGQPALVMPYLWMCNREALATNQEFGKAAAKALKYMASKGYKHNDLSPRHVGFYIDAFELWLLYSSTYPL